MTETGELIERLAAGVQPVRRLTHPFYRAGGWLAGAWVIVGLLVLEQGVRPDFWQQMNDGTFLLRLGTSFATGVLAAVGCMVASMPDRSRLWLLLPAPALVLWLSTIGYGCLTDWVEIDGGRTQPGEVWRCLGTLLMTSLPLSAAMLLMLRHAAPLRPKALTLTAGLSVAAITASAMSILHPLDATMMILIWNLCAALVIVAVEALLGWRLLVWFAKVLAH
jgi:hypothetical protein